MDDETRVEVGSMIETMCQIQLDQTVNSYGCVKIPIGYDKVFRNHLEYILKGVFPNTQQVNLENLLDEIIRGFQTYEPQWTRTVGLTRDKDFQNVLRTLDWIITTETIKGEFPSTQNNRNPSLNVFHSIPEWAIDLCLHYIKDPECYRKMVDWCVITHVCDFHNKEIAEKHGFLKEYELYQSLMDILVESIYDKLYKRALKRYLLNPDKYQMEQYCTCDRQLDPDTNQYSWMQTSHEEHGTLPLINCVMKELQLSSKDTNYYTLVKYAISQLMALLKREDWDYRYFRTNIENGTIVNTDPSQMTEDLYEDVKAF